jgi:hypothetical protein
VALFQQGFESPSEKTFCLLPPASFNFIPGEKLLRELGDKAEKSKNQSRYS